MSTMKFIKLISGALFLAVLVSSFTAKSISETKICDYNPLTGQWSVTWSNNAVANLETRIEWSLNQDGTGTETITTSGKESKENTTLKFPLSWETTETRNHHTFIEIRYGPRIAINKKDEPLNNFENSLMQEKSNTSISMEYFYYGDSMLYINKYLDGETAKNKLARTRLEKVSKLNI